jgi:hypothetical protein
MQLRDQSRAVGLNWAEVQARLPDWASEAVQHEAGRIELEGFVARHFGFRLRAGGGFEPAPLPQALFKARASTDPSTLLAARGYATAVARAVAKATRMPWSSMPSEPALLRALALEAAAERGWVDFAALVEASWRLGIPVVYLPRNPGGGRKPDGLATFVAGRPVIVLLKRQWLAEWMAFILAHELGHVALGHLDTAEGAAVVDEKVVPTAETPDGPDAEPEDRQERAADDFAGAVLVPGGHRLSLGPPPWPNAVKHTRRGDKQPFELGMSTLRILHESMNARTTAEVCRDAARRHLDLDAVPADTAEFLEKLDIA